MHSSLSCWDPLPPRTGEASREGRRRRRLLLETKNTLSTDKNMEGVTEEHRHGRQAEASSTSVAASGQGERSENHINNKTKETSNEQQSKSPAPAKRKPNRPGFNSYLKVLLDDVSMGRLYEAAQLVQQRMQQFQDTEQGGVSATDENTMEENGASFTQAKETSCNNNHGKSQKGARKKNHRSLRFKPRPRASLHMTFFFGGETLCELEPDELTEWHGLVRDRLEQSGFCLKDTDQQNSSHTAANDATEQHDDDGDSGEYWFQATELCTFPPQRRNLVVAILEPSPAWHKLHNDVRDIAKNGRIQALREVAGYSKDAWTAHITLGNIFGGNKKQIRDLLTLPLKEISEEFTIFRARSAGIAMGGPAPEQLSLDWDFCRDNQKIHPQRTSTPMED